MSDCIQHMAEWYCHLGLPNVLASDHNCSRPELLWSFDGICLKNCLRLMCPLVILEAVNPLKVINWNFDSWIDRNYNEKILWSCLRPCMMVTIPSHFNISFFNLLESIYLLQMDIKMKVFGGCNWLWDARNLSTYLHGNKCISNQLTILMCCPYQGRSRKSFLLALKWKEGQKLAGRLLHLHSISPQGHGLIVKKDCSSWAWLGCFDVCCSV